jgi:hypothetical protein
MKKILKLVAILFSTFLIVGCSKPKITKEQQDNVVMWIARGYEVKEVEFISFTKNDSTGTYILKVKINNDDSMVSTLSIFHYESLNSQDGLIALSPREDFESIIKKKRLNHNDTVSISNIKIKYLGER